jgi:hypothetical protein
MTPEITLTQLWRAAQDACNTARKRSLKYPDDEDYATAARQYQVLQQRLTQAVKHSDIPRLQRELADAERKVLLEVLSDEEVERIADVVLRFYSETGA